MVWLLKFDRLISGVLPCTVNPLIILYEYYLVLFGKNWFPPSPYTNWLIGFSGQRHWIVARGPNCTRRSTGLKQTPQGSLGNDL